MNVNLTGNGLELTDALRDFVKSKFSKLSRYSDGITQTHVVLTTKGKRQKAEASLHVSHGKDLHASCETDDMYASIDELVDKVDRMLEKQKGKTINKRYKGDQTSLFSQEENVES